MLIFFKISVYLFIAVIGLSSPRALAQQYVYGAYSQFPQGSSRAMAMGGAYTGISDDVFGVLYNPAGPALGKWSVDAGGTKNSVTNRETPIFGTSTSFGLPYDFIFAAMGARIGSWVLAIGMSSPYSLKYQGLSETAELSIFSADIYLAKKFGDKFSIGIGGHGEKLTESYKDTTLGYDVKTEADTSFVSYGLMYRGGKGGFGASYSPTHSFDIDDNLNTQLGSTVWFRDAVVPGRMKYGVFYKLSDDKTVAIDLDNIEAISNAIFVGSGISGASSETPIIDKKQSILHGGFEWAVSKSNKNEIYLRFGGYKEPSRVESVADRMHLTFGLEVRFGPAVLSVAYDQARDFTNTAQGFSLSFGSI